MTLPQLKFKRNIDPAKEIEVLKLEGNKTSRLSPAPPKKKNKRRKCISKEKMTTVSTTVEMKTENWPLIRQDGCFTDDFVEKFPRRMEAYAKWVQDRIGVFWAVWQSIFWYTLLVLIYKKCRENRKSKAKTIAGL